MRFRPFGGRYIRKRKEADGDGGAEGDGRRGRRLARGLGRHVGTDLAHGLAESPGWNVFKLEDGVVYHTYSRRAPDRFLLTPFYFQLLDQVPDGRDGDFPLGRHDEY